MSKDIKNLIIFYVNDTKVSQEFYKDLLNLEAFYNEDHFVLFKLSAYAELGLWAQDAVVPEAQAVSEAQELAFEVSSRVLVDIYYKKLKTQGVTIKQAPTDLDFGYALTFLDPDGHRLRVYYMEKQI